MPPRAIGRVICAAAATGTVHLDLPDGAAIDGPAWGLQHADALHLDDALLPLLTRLRLGLPVGRTGVCGRLTTDPHAVKDVCSAPARRAPPAHLPLRPMGAHAA